MNEDVRSAGDQLVPAPRFAYSERLGSITAVERRLEEELGATLAQVPLWSHADIQEHGSSADAIFVGAVEPMDAQALATLRRCRLLLRRGVGVDNIDLSAATELGIPVAFVPNASVHEVSDHALALLLAVERRVARLDRLVKQGDWTRSTATITTARRGMRRLSELTLGIVGFGRIGQEFARKAQPLFARQVVVDPYLSAAEPASNTDLVGFDELLRVSDVISIHAPLTAENWHLFNRSTLGALQPGCTIINTSRGGLIDTDALVEQLQSGRLRGAGLDVTEEEPIPADHPLLELDSVLLTAHSAAASDTSATEARVALVTAATAGFAGRTPEFIANPDVLERAGCRIRPGWTPR